MEGIKKRHIQTSQALKTLKAALDNYQNRDAICSPEKKEYESITLALRDSVIKRFEYCF
jgi:hypothetical protein